MTLVNIIRGARRTAGGRRSRLPFIKNLFLYNFCTISMARGGTCNLFDLLIARNRRNVCRSILTNISGREIKFTHPRVSRACHTGIFNVSR